MAEAGPHSSMRPAMASNGRAIALPHTSGILMRTGSVSVAHMAFLLSFLTSEERTMALK